MVGKSEGGEAAKKMRLAEELRANLARRKAQSRSRRAGEADGRAEGIGEAGAPSPDAAPSGRSDETE